MIRLRQVTLLVTGLFIPLAALSQTPSDLAVLSLQELMSLDIDENSNTTEAQDIKQWGISYSYQRLELDGYRTGTKNLSDEKVIFRPSKTRTSKNYPVLSTVITQEVHTLNFAYKWNKNLQFGITAPYILQSTEHESIAADFDEFTIKSEGIGDVSVNVAYTFPLETSANWKVLFGLSLPTGSIKEQGDTPRNGEGTDEQLPYTMHLGSGTYDFPLSIQYSHHYQIIVECLLTANNTIKTRVTDSGIGIPISQQDKLFTAFSRLGQENSTIEGTGVGLVVTKSLIEAMHGKIGFSSTEGEGSTFWFELPLSDNKE